VQINQKNPKEANRHKSSWMIIWHTWTAHISLSNYPSYLNFE